MTPSDDRPEVFRRKPLSESDLDVIHAQAMRILEDIGTEVDARACCACSLKPDSAWTAPASRWDAGFVMEQLAKAPSQFTLQGRTPVMP